MVLCEVLLCFFFFKQKTAYEMRISDWSSDVCSSDLVILKAPLPNPPLPSQGREQRARGFRRSYKEGRRSVLRLLQRPALVHGDVVGLVALDLVLGIVLAAVPGVAVPVEVLHVHFRDLAADVAGFGIPRDVVADLELV